MEIFPSIISSDILNLKQVIESLEPHAAGYHVDVMDNHFVPNLTWGPDFVNAISQATKLPICIHLMVDNPKNWIAKLKLKQEDLFVFHYEAIQNKNNINNLIKEIKATGVNVGIAINPNTPINSVAGYLKDLDQLIIMSVEPGFSGQKFIPEVVSKIDEAISFKKDNNLSFIICLDGGVNEDNIRMLLEKGVERVAVASAIFSKDDPINAINNLKKLLQ